MYRDTDFNPRSEEELREEERERELQRRIRREVRRIQSGEADEEMAEERAREEAEAEETGAPPARHPPPAAPPDPGGRAGPQRRPAGVGGGDTTPLLIAGTFLLSIVVMFWALRLDMTHTRTEREVELLREKAVRLQEQRSRLTTHSAVVEELRRRNIPLHDPVVPGEIIEE